MLARLDPGRARARVVPARRPGQGGDAGGGGARRARRWRGGSRARRRASSPATTTARSSAGTGSRRRTGPIVDEQGRELGRHEGFWRFTPGQRKGIGVPAGAPLYVLGADAATNAVVVGPREALARRRVAASGRLYSDVDRADVKLRYRSPAVAARVSAAAGGFELELDEPAFGVAPGQAAVLYEGDAVVGCGLVSSADAD